MEGPWRISRSLDSSDIRRAVYGAASLTADGSSGGNVRFHTDECWVVETGKDCDAGFVEVQRRFDTDGNRPVEPETGDDRAMSATVSWGASSGVLAGEYDPTTGTLTVATSSNEDDSDPEHGGHVGLVVSADCRHLVRACLGYNEVHVGENTATDACLDSLRDACMGVSSGETDGGTGIRRSGRATRSAAAASGAGRHGPPANRRQL